MNKIEIGTIVRIKPANDCYDNCLAKVIEWTSEDAKVEFFDWPEFHGPIQDKYVPPYPGASITLDCDDLTVISPLEYLAEQAD